MSNQINEIFFLRSLACLAIVILHTLTNVRSNFLTLDPIGVEILSGIELLLKFGTPLFIFISEVLIAYKYSEKIPNDFLLKRAKYILIPFSMMAIFYGITTPLQFGNEVTLIGIIENFFGGYHGYFVLIIFQFYVLHMVFMNFLNKSKPFKILSIALIINVLYLSFFNLTTVPESGLLYYLWVKLYYMPFLAWIFYFVLAFYIGKNYDYLKERILKPWIFLLPVISGALMIIFTLSGIIELSSSKRFDMIFYSLSMGLIIIYISRFFVFPRLLNVISRYSFGIYLTHMFYVYVYVILFSNTNLGWMLLPIILTLVLISSIFTTWLFNKIPYGEYVVGKVGISYNYNEK